MICCLNPDCPNPINSDGTNFCLSCGTGLIHLLRGRYQIIEPLGSGGFGRTYLAEDRDKLNEQCAVKQLAPQVQGSWAFQKATELFQQEAKRLQQLGKHPQIPTLYAYFQEDNYLYLVQEFIEGQNLLQELKQGIFSEAKICKLLSDLLPVLQSVHEQQVIHRDIKPANLIRRKTDGKVVLIDFGVAKAATATAIARPGTIIGSLGYAPIEQMQDGEVFPASDLYSLGATCFYLLTNVSPHQLWVEQGYGWVTNWNQYLNNPISSGLETVLSKLLKKDIQQRYQSAQAVIDELKGLSTVITPPQSLPTQPSLTQLPPDRRTLDLLWQAAIASSGGWLVAIALLSFLGTVWISPIVWLLILGSLIFIQKRPISEKAYLFIVVILTTLGIYNLFQNLPRSLPVIALLLILAGLMGFALIALTQLINKLISQLF